MRISPDALADFAQKTGVVEPTVRYVRTGEMITIGSKVITGHAPRRISAGVSARPLGSDTVETGFVVERIGSASSTLYSIAIKQTPGAMWYDWTDANGVAHNHLICATSPDRELNAALNDTRLYFKRRTVEDRLAYRFGISPARASNVCTAVGAHLNLCTAACALAEHMQAAHNTIAEARDAIARMRGGNLQATYARLKQLRAAPSDPNNAGKVLVGALWALPLPA